MFFARTLSWLGFFPRFTSVTCFRTFLHLCSCSTFSPARRLAESTLFPQSRRCDWPHFVIILEVFILWRTFASGELTHLLWILQESWIQHGTVKENILFGMPFDVEKYSAVIDACALVEVWKKSALFFTLYRRTASVKAYGLIGLLTAVQWKIFTEKLRRVLKSWGCQFHYFNYQLTVN